jgi:hypothetical protein
LEPSVARYLAQLDTADLQEPSERLAATTARYIRRRRLLPGISISTSLRCLET